MVTAASTHLPAMFAILRDAGLLPPLKKPSHGSAVHPTVKASASNGSAAAPAVPSDSEVIKEVNYRGAYLRLGPGTHDVPKALFRVNR